MKKAILLYKSTVQGTRDNGRPLHMGDEMRRGDSLLTQDGWCTVTVVPRVSITEYMRERYCMQYSADVGVKYVTGTDAEHYTPFATPAFLNARWQLTERKPVVRITPNWTETHTIIFTDPQARLALIRYLGVTI